MVIPCIYSTCWHMKSTFYEHQHILILISCIASTFLDLCLMSSLPKGERMHTKWSNSFANWVVERSLWKHDKFYLRGRALIEKVVGSTHNLELCHGPHTIFISICLRGNVTH
jgi:hypothetical protein